MADLPSCKWFYGTCKISMLDMALLEGSQPPLEKMVVEENEINIYTCVCARQRKIHQRNERGGKGNDFQQRSHLHEAAKV